MTTRRRTWLPHHRPVLHEPRVVVRVLLVCTHFKDCTALGREKTREEEKQLNNKYLLVSHKVSVGK
jgi:hypothetical protein